MSDANFPEDWPELEAAARRAGWLLGGGWDAGDHTPLTYSAFNPAGVYPNYERRTFATAAEVRAWVAAGCPSAVYREGTIVTGDARALAASIPDGSVDLILCDPVYQNIADYAWLAETALRVLKPRGVCLAWASVPKAGRAQQAMEDGGMQYVYTLFYTVTAKTHRMRWYNLFCWTTPCLWLQRPHEATKPSQWMPDTFSEAVLMDNTDISSANPNDPFAWNKNTGVLRRYIERFCPPGGLVYDPFAGSGSVPVACIATGRRFLAGEIDAGRAEGARARLAATPQPLALELAGQGGMFAEADAPRKTKRRKEAA